MKETIPLKLGFLVSALLLFAACAAPTQTTLSDGTVAYRIECEGTARGVNYCLERAGKSCGAVGYTIVDQDGRMISGGDVADSAGQSRISEYATDQNSLLFRCGS